MKRVSPKRASDLREYNRLKKRLLARAGGKSELSGETAEELIPHHIEGREGSKLYDPYNIILVTNAEHLEIHKHNTREQKEKLKAIVRPLRKEFEE